MEQRRLLLAVALSVLLLIAYQELVVRRYQEPGMPPGSPVAGEQAAPPQARKPSAPEPKMAGELAAPVGEGGVIVETDLVRAVITPVGGRLAEFELKKYRRDVGPDSEPLSLLRKGPIPILPLALRLGNRGSDASWIYRPDREALTLRGDERGEVRLVAESPGGLRVEKRFTFAGNSYLFEVATVVSGAEQPPSIELLLTPPPEKLSGPEHDQPIALVNRRLVPVEKIKEEPVSPVGVVWAGFATPFFLAAAVPPAGAAEVSTVTVDGIPLLSIETPVRDGQAAFAVYVGPKEQASLAQAGHGLDRALDFGWFWFVAIPLLHALRALHSVFGNYGVAIIVLTTLIKVATIPLTQATFRNMREMQKIQPQMQKLRERFKGDQTALQKEMMELYRRHRVNPFSGCIPMLLQIPIFVGLYNALSSAIELRHAPFAFWINDLSAPDRLMIGGIGVPVLTLLMGATMFLQQWMTPQQGDPTQQRMMMFMPLIFTFMFVNFPAGLVLYWLVNNVLSIAQQYWMLRSAS